MILTAASSLLFGVLLYHVRIRKILIAMMDQRRWGLLDLCGPLEHQSHSYGAFSFLLNRFLWANTSAVLCLLSKYIMVPILQIEHFTFQPCPFVVFFFFMLIYVYHKFGRPDSATIATDALLLWKGVIFCCASTFHFWQGADLHLNVSLSLV